MTFDEVLRHYGSRIKIAARLHCTRQNITRWEKVGVPLRRQLEIQIDTEGKLLIGPQIGRPSPKIWPRAPERLR